MGEPGLKSGSSEGGLKTPRVFRPPHYKARGVDHPEEVFYTSTSNSVKSLIENDIPPFEIPDKTLTPEERDELRQLVQRGRTAGYRIRHAQSSWLWMKFRKTAAGAMSG